MVRVAGDGRREWWWRCGRGSFGSLAKTRSGMAVYMYDSGDVNGRHVTPHASRRGSYVFVIT